MTQIFFKFLLFQQLLAGLLVIGECILVGTSDYKSLDHISSVILLYLQQCLVKSSVTKAVLYIQVLRVS